MHGNAMLLSVADDRRYFIRQLLSYIVYKENTDYEWFFGPSNPENQKRNHFAIFILKTRDLHDAIINDSGTTLLHFAAKNDNLEITKYLVEQGLNVNVQDKHGNTALMCVLLEYKRRFIGRIHLDNPSTMIKIIEVLLKSGTNYDLLNNDCLNALQLAINLPLEAFQHTVDIYRLFLKTLEIRCESDKELMAKTLVDNDCLLERVILLNDPDLTKIMIARGSPVNKHSFGMEMTPLHAAADLMSLENVKVLIAHGADVLAEDKFGGTPLQYYTGGGFYADTKHRQEPEVVRTFMNVIKDANRRCRGRFIVERLARNGNEEALRIILEHDVDFREQDKRGRTLLHHFAENSGTNVARLLKGRVFNPNICDNEGNTALVNAISNVNASMTQLLLESGADANIAKPNGGCNAIGHAIAQRNEYHWDFFSANDDIRRSMEGNIALLLNYGAKVRWIYQESIIKFFQDPGYCSAVEILLAHLAIDDTLGEPINSQVLEHVSSDQKIRNRFIVYKQQLLEMKRIMVYGSLTMFALVCDDEKFIARRYAYNLDLLEKFEIFHEESYSNNYYDSLALTRLARVISSIKLIQKATLIICSLIRVERIVDSVIVREIISYLDYVDILNLNKLVFE